MSERNRFTTACFVGVTAVILTLALPVDAQVPSNQPALPAKETVDLTMEQKHIVKELIIKDLKVSPPADQAGKQVPTKVGDVIPTGIPIQPMPVEVSAKIPQLKAHSFVVKDEKVIIVDPKDNKVAALVE